MAPVAFHTLPPRLFRNWGRTDGQRHRILSFASSLQITFEEELSLCNNTISVTWFHTAGSCLTLWINHTSAELIWEQSLISLQVAVIPTHQSSYINPLPLVQADKVNAAQSQAISKPRIALHMLIVFFTTNTFNFFSPQCSCLSLNVRDRRDFDSSTC